MLDNDWAGFSVYCALLIGLLTTAYSGVRAVLGRNQSFLQPDIACVLFMWCGYHLSPIISLFSGKNWRAFMLVPDYIESALWMSLFCSWAFVLGYRVLSMRENSGRPTLQTWAQRSAAILQQSYHVKKAWLWLYATVVTIIFITYVGGFNDIWDASYTRGEGNWLEHTSEVRFIRFLGVILPLSTFGLLAITVVMSVSGERSWTKNLTIWFALFAASINAIHSFSRGAGVAFFGLAIIRYVLIGRRDWKIFFASIAVGFWLSYVGYVYRGEYRPGVGNYIEASIRSLTESPEMRKAKTREEFIATEDNFLSAIEAYTAVVSYVDGENLEPLSDFLQFVYNLHPFPSGLLGLAQRGVDLTSVMRTYGNVGLTTPTMGDLYVTFSYLTPVVYFGLGILYRLMISQGRLYGPTIETVLLLLLFIGWPISLHSSFRALWRIVNVVIAILFGLYLLRRRGYFKNVPTIVKPPPFQTGPIFRRT